MSEREMYTQSFTVSWADVDANAHMRNTSFLERAADTRLRYFLEFGFSLKEFQRKKFGPVVKKDEVEYFRELDLLGSFAVSFELAGMSDDASRMRLRHCFYKDDDILLAKITTLAGWMDLDKRKLIAPPDTLKDALNKLTKTSDFEVLPSSLKSR